MSKGTMLALLGAVLGVVGVFTPWAAGISGWAAASGANAGKAPYVFLVLAILAGLLALMGDMKKAKGMMTGSLVLGVLMLLIMILQWPGSELSEYIEYGFWLSFVSGIVVIVGAVMGKKAAMK